MSARLARRKEKVEYEPIPVVTQQPVPPKEIEEDTVITAPTVGRVIHTAATPSRIITNDNVEHEGYLEPLKRTAEKYKPMPAVSIPQPPPVDFDTDDAPKPTSSKVANVQDIPRTPIDEVVPGYSKIFGSKKKDPITIGDSS